MDEDAQIRALIGEEENECKMCFDVMEKDLCMLSNCEHAFHQECVQRYLEAEID